MGGCVCIAHSQDVDGLVSAAILKASRDASPILVDYTELLSELMLIGNDVSELYVCDLSVGSRAAGEMKKLAKRMSVTYIDHHPLQKDISEDLIRNGVRVIHSTDKCAGFLCYMTFKDKLPDWAALLAAYASLSDYPSPSREVSLFLGQFDPKILAFEHSAFYFAVANSDPEFKLQIIDAISKGTPPHAVPGLLHYASDMLDYMSNTVENANSRIKYARNIGYIEVKAGASIIANAMIKVVRAPVLVCFEKYMKSERYNIAIRVKGINCNLGILASEVAIKNGGLGGGHPFAAGAQIPTSSIWGFLEALDDELDRFCR